MAKAKGWFKTADRDGDRTVEQQLVGLDSLLSKVAGKSVLDVGCAEGLLDAKLIDAGAKAVHGIEVVAGHVEYARRHAKPGMTFEVADAGRLDLAEQYDVVLLLAILHKLKDPAAAALKYAKAARELVVLRLPPAGPYVKDARSGGKEIDIGAVLVAAGFALESQTKGTFDEWIGYYVRPATITAPPPVAVPVAQVTPITADAAVAPTPDAVTPTPDAVATSSDAAPLSSDAVPAPTPEPVKVATAFKPWPFGKAVESAPAEDLFEKTTPISRVSESAEPPAEAPVPPNSVHPAGDPAVQLPVEKIEMPQMEGERQDAPRREPQTRDPV